MQSPLAALSSLAALVGGARPRSRERLSPAQRLMMGLRPLRVDVTAGLRTMARVPTLQDRLDTLHPAKGLTGRWRKDADASDSMQEAVEMVALPFYLRPALGLLKTLEIEDSDAHFKTNLKAGGLMDVIESYPWSGDSVPHSRRDKRRGKHVGYVTRVEGRHPCIVVSWSDPYGGSCSDTFLLSECGKEMTQLTEMHVVGSNRRTRYKTVYRRVSS